MSSAEHPGASWRLLVHEHDHATHTDIRAHHVVPAGSRLADGRLIDERLDGPFTTTHVLPWSTVFDEIAVGSWLHAEELDTGCWTCTVGPLNFTVAVNPDGSCATVMLFEYDPERGEADLDSFGWDEAPA